MSGDDTIPGGPDHVLITFTAAMRSSTTGTHKIRFERGKSRPKAGCWSSFSQLFVRGGAGLLDRRATGTESGAKIRSGQSNAPSGPRSAPVRLESCGIGGEGARGAACPRA